MKQTRAKVFPIEDFHGGKVTHSPTLYKYERFYHARPMLNGTFIARSFYWGSKKAQYNYSTQEEAKKACEEWIYVTMKSYGRLKNEYRRWSDGTVEVKLNKGRTMFIDEEDLPIMKKAIWCGDMIGDEYTFHAVTSNYEGRQTSFHRVITKHRRVYHINGHGLDNRKINLRGGKYTFRETDEFQRKEGA